MLPAKHFLPVLVLALALSFTACDDGGEKKSNSPSKKWTHPASATDFISLSGNETARNPHAAMDADGNLIIVWVQDDGSDDQMIYKKEYRNGVWTNPASLNDSISPATSDADYPKVAMDDNGDAIIVWKQIDNDTVNQIFRREYRSGVWSIKPALTEFISTDGADQASDPQVAMDDNGDAIITWNQDNNVYKDEYRAGVWSGHDNLGGSPGDPYSPSISVAMSNNGGTIIAWWEPSIPNISTGEYRWTGTNFDWGTYDDFIPTETDGAQSPDVAMDASGNAMLVWEQYNSGGKGQIFMSEYRNWGTAAAPDWHWDYPEDADDNFGDLLGLETYEALSPKTAMNAAGKAIIVWQQQYEISEGYTRIYAREFSGGSWSVPVVINDDSTFAKSASVSVSANGHAVVAWHQEYDMYGYKVYMSEYRGSSWSDPVIISPDGAYSHTGVPPIISMDDDGNAIIVWVQSYGGGSSGWIMMSQYR